MSYIGTDDFSAEESSQIDKFNNKQKRKLGKVPDFKLYKDFKIFKKGLNPSFGIHIYFKNGEVISSSGYSLKIILDFADMCIDFFMKQRS